MTRTDRQQMALDIVSGFARELADPAVTLARVEEASKELATVAGWLEEEWPVAGPKWQLPFAPGESYPLGQPWGYDPNYDGNTEHFHRGIDLLMPLGTMVCAVAAGTVVIASQGEPQGRTDAADGAWGGYVEIDHGDGLHSGYCHLAGILGFPGQRVRSGQAIGTVGLTGLTFGAHGHINALLNDVRVDPAPYFV